VTPPTEVTIGCSVVRVNKRTSPRSIGRIFDNCEAFVLKPDTLDLTIRGQAGVGPTFLLMKL
jgi:hypothetical protein